VAYSSQPTTVTQGRQLGESRVMQIESSPLPAPSWSAASRLAEDGTNDFLHRRILAAVALSDGAPLLTGDPKHFAFEWAAGGDLTAWAELPLGAVLTFPEQTPRQPIGSPVSRLLPA
jgi:hypothetical protein